MPMKAGSSDKAISANIEKLIGEGYKPKEAQAIAYEHAGRAKPEKKKVEAEDKEIAKPKGLSDMKGHHGPGLTIIIGMGEEKKPK